MASNFLWHHCLCYLPFHQRDKILGECGTLFDTTYRHRPSERFENSTDTWNHKYRTPEHWIPSGTTPFKTILVNWVICRDDNGDNGWQDCQEFRDQVSLMFERINLVYAGSLPKGYTLSCEPEYSHVYNSKIQFELNDIIFLNNTQFNQCSLHSNNTIPIILDYLYDNYPSSKVALNHIFSQPYNDLFSRLGKIWRLWRQLICHNKQVNVPSYICGLGRPRCTYYP